jgi:hypothetical protein
MDDRLPPLAPPISRQVGLTLEILRQPTLALELHRGLAELADQLSADLDERVYVRIRLGSAWLEGWYVARTREIEPIALIRPVEAA